MTEKLLDKNWIRGKVVLIRTDYDVPLKEGKIEDDSRIKASLPTLETLIADDAKTIIILCHLGRPEGKVVEALSLNPIERRLREMITDSSSIIFEENLRFNPGEEANDPEFAKYLAKKGEVFINEAFAVSHRNHASIILLPKLLPSDIGLHFRKEIRALDKVIDSPARPLVVVLGGAKLETKLPMIKKMENLADVVLVGGKVVEEIKKKKIKVKQNVVVAELTPSGRDISQESIRIFTEKIQKAGTVVWNGPMGVFEEHESSLGTKAIAQAINKSQGYSVIGGGDTEAAATIFHAENNLDHISIGGGALLQYLVEG